MTVATRKKPADPEYSFDWEAQKHYKSRYGWRKWERVGMRPNMSLDDLILFWPDKKIPDLDVKGAVSEITFHRTIEGASTVTMSIIDPNRIFFKRSVGRVTTSKQRALREAKNKKERAAIRNRTQKVDASWQPIDSPNIVGEPVELWLDNVAFRLVKVEYNWMDSASVLTFEDRVIYSLKRITGARSAKRGKHTRAEFILSQLREYRAEKVPFICPELHKKQPIAPQKRTTERSSADFPTSGGNLNRRFPAHSAGQTGVQLTEEEVRACAAAGGFYGRELQGMDEISQGESNRMPGVISADGGIGLWQMTPRVWGAAGIAKMNELGGEAEMRNPIKNAMMAHYLYKQAGDSFRPWYGQGFLTVDPGPGKGASRQKARNMAERVLGGDFSTITPNSEQSYTKPYHFKRDKRENAWTSMSRLAEEVNWRLFMVGRAMYFMAERDLYARTVRYTITPDSDSFIDVNFEMDWGKPVSTARLQVNLDRWGAPPGSVIMLDGFGTPDGRWLVKDVERNWFDPTAEITLEQPSPAKKEPAPDVVTRSIDDINIDLRGIRPKDLKGLTPADIINKIVLPISNQSGVPRTVAQNNASNSTHGPTTSGGTSDHQGPPNVRWAADMSNGSSPTREMDNLARTLTRVFQLQPNGDGSSANGTNSGFRFQLLYRTNTGGNHFNHVHFGVAVA